MSADFTKKIQLNAYLQAAIDFGNGHTLENDNPYPKGTKEYKIWERYLNYLVKEFPACSIEI